MSRSHTRRRPAHTRDSYCPAGRLRYGHSSHSGSFADRIPRTVRSGRARRRRTLCTPPHPFHRTGTWSRAGNFPACPGCSCSSHSGSFVRCRGTPHRPHHRPGPPHTSHSSRRSRPDHTPAPHSRGRRCSADQRSGCQRRTWRNAPPPCRTPSQSHRPGTRRLHRSSRSGRWWDYRCPGTVRWRRHTSVPPGRRRTLPCCRSRLRRTAGPRSWEHSTHQTGCTD